MKSYEAIVTREGRWWMIEIPELDGLTQARRLDDVDQMAREYIAVTLDAPISQVAVSISGIEVAGQDVLEAKALVEDLRRRARQLEALIADLTREFASAMADASVPVRDVSNVLGVSHQRVSQLVQAAGGEQAPGLAQVMLAAKTEYASDLIIRFKAGQAPQILEVKSPRKTRDPRRSRPRRTATQEVGRTAVRKSANTGNIGAPGRSTVAGRSSPKKAKADKG
jgi:hypothetical protein